MFLLMFTIKEKNKNRSNIKRELREEIRSLSNIGEAGGTLLLGIWQQLKGQKEKRKLVCRKTSV